MEDNSTEVELNEGTNVQDSNGSDKVSEDSESGSDDEDHEVSFSKRAKINVNEMSQDTMTEAANSNESNSADQQKGNENDEALTEAEEASMRKFACYLEKRGFLTKPKELKTRTEEQPQPSTSGFNKKKSNNQKRLKSVVTEPQPNRGGKSKLDSSSSGDDNESELTIYENAIQWNCQKKFVCLNRLTKTGLVLHQRKWI